MLTRLTEPEAHPEREHAARRSSAEAEGGPQAAFTPATMLALQRSGVGNHVLSRAILARQGRTLARTVQASDALRQIEKLVQLLEPDKLGELLALREEIKASKKGAISAAQETELTRLVALLQTPTRDALGVQALMEQTDLRLTRRAQTIVDTRKGPAKNLAEVMLVARLNRIGSGKLNLYVEGGTTAALAGAAAEAAGYAKFEHVKWAPPTKTQSTKTFDVFELKLTSPGHRNAGVFVDGMKEQLARASFGLIEGPRLRVKLYKKDAHREAELTTMLAEWHSGIADDKTMAGQYRQDEGHPTVANVSHRDPHTHVQAVGCDQVTILYAKPPR